MLIDLTPNRPVAGGFMLATHDGRVVLVRGAVPGERVRVRVERVRKGVAWASVVDVLEPSADRRVARCDLECGGSAYAHIAYPRQLALKAEVIADAFRHLGGMELDLPVAVAASPEDGYRLLARLHLQGRRWGFFREGSHALCDAGATGQIAAASLEAIGRFQEMAPDLFSRSAALVLAENIAATERVLHFELHAAATAAGVSVALPPDISGVTASPTGRPLRSIAGREAVEDTAASVFAGPPPIDGATTWRRRPTSFFQANRYFLGALVRRVLDAVDTDAVADLYAGVGLFGVALAARGARVVAVESDASSGADLVDNARPFSGRLHVVRATVEDALAPVASASFDVAVVDPPRTGMSPAARAALVEHQPRRIVYVSCDPPTLARDSAKLIESGYRLEGLDAFDLFPNTPHVEVVAVFDSRSS